METMTIKVGGMTCGGCVASVTRVLVALDGVAEASVSLERNEAVVKIDPAKVNRAQLAAAIEGAGFDTA
ncbi:MAG: hypothetical protein CVU17_01860 [Betaproteobacteria bacterium HGW-Betaproteobacteria-11]|nr:MAG: hypothetical protein CVU17_01860 [Betaproteobacteria bacterium HGW-Betaproteobacteria-11]